MRRIHRWLAGNDGPGRRALPAGELLHPVSLAAAAVMTLNDQILKGAGILPGALTGKLSDLAGLVFFPLLCTAGADLILLGAARLGAPVDFSLRRYKLVTAILFTGALFAAMNISQGFADDLAAFIGALGIPSTIVADTTDLLTMPSLALAYWLGRREIARVPLGRIEVLERNWARGDRGLEVQLVDIAACGGDAALVASLGNGLSDYFMGGDADASEAALRELRDG